MSVGSTNTGEQIPIEELRGKLGVLLPGMGAVGTSFIAGVEAVRRGLGEPIGSLTQMGTIRLGKRSDKRTPAIRDFVPLATLDDLVFGGWDIRDESSYHAAQESGVLKPQLLDQVREFMESVRPMPAVFDQNYVRRLDGTHVKKGKNKMELAKMLQDDIERFRAEKGLSRVVMVWCGSTEVFLKPQDVHQTLELFECGLKENHPAIAPSMIYAYAALQCGVPIANGAPNLMVDVPALTELARQNSLPICGKDFKTGQTLMKTILAPGFKARLLGLSGWFSTNILGNRDGKCWTTRIPSRPRKRASSRCWSTSCNRTSTRRSTRTSTTRCGSTTTRPGETTKKAGTISTSSAGSAIPCRSRSTSCAGIRSWPRRWCWTWSYSWTWPSGPGCGAFRSGCRSTSRAPCAPPPSTRSMTCSSN